MFLMLILLCVSTKHENQLSFFIHWNACSEHSGITSVCNSFCYTTLSKSLFSGLVYTQYLLLSTTEVLVHMSTQANSSPLSMDCNQLRPVAILFGVRLASFSVLLTVQLFSTSSLISLSCCLRSTPVICRFLSYFEMRNQSLALTSFPVLTIYSWYSRLTHI